MLAHEIRTPLNGILAMSELIAAADLPERERQWAAHVKGAAEHLAALATLVVDGVRAEKRGLVLREEVVPPARAGRRNSARRLRRARKPKGLAADVSIADDLPELVIGDRVRLRAALENLIDNAVKFTEHGRVGLSVNAARGAARAASAQLHGDRQRHRAVEGGDRAAVPAVQAGECGHRAPLRRLRAWACVRAAARQGDGRRSHGQEPRRTGQHVYVQCHACRGTDRCAERRREC